MLLNRWDADCKMILERDEEKSQCQLSFSHGKVQYRQQVAIAERR
ncbi:hypothetical protein [Vibrio vulnificus YJ016]|uniref:Uncharacterized protein n=1 Tax=Vibrio vulnificus (strain YJ016) TaxID=196600 RepID=Q7MDU3_VIBVY|nr:hypothetical protein [Vibrio vulnificus YJ016]